jgi:hypothetical protein
MTDITYDRIEEALDAISEAMQETWSRFGWVKGQLGSDSNGYCLVGAFRRATMGNTHESPGYIESVFRSQATKAIALLWPDARFISPENWNDNVAQSEEDVRLVAKHAIARMKDVIAEAAPKPLA